MDQSHETLRHKGHHQVCHGHLVGFLGLQLKLPISSLLVNHSLVTDRHVCIHHPFNSRLEAIHTCKGLESCQPNLEVLCSPLKVGNFNKLIMVDIVLQF